MKTVPCFLRNTSFITNSFCLFFIISIRLSAQNISNETNFFIPSGIEMHTNGSLINEGFFQNNGSFFLGGDWTNASVYQGLGFVSLEGGNQTITNNNQSIEHLIINESGLKTVRGKLSVKDILELNQGIVLVADVDTLLLESTCRVIGASLESYVNGALTVAGSGYRFFPIGKNGKYRPVELVNIKGISPITEMEIFENLPLIETNFPATIDPSVYWKRATIGGTFIGSVIALATEIPTTNRTVIAAGANFNEPFSLVSDVISQTKNNINWIVSTGDVNANFFAIGDLVNDPPKPYYFSTTLSPNAADPGNRVIKVFGDSMSNDYFYFQVFNRWGGSIFESKSYSIMASEGWNGTQEGSLLPSGVYPYSIRYVDGQGKANQHTGFITIIH